MARFRFNHPYKGGARFAAAVSRMKIAFIGTHGTGKTTLCHLLTGEMRKRGMNAEMVTEIARKCPLPINKDTTHDAQLWILVTQIASEIEAAGTYEHVICDRSVLDNYAYEVVHSGRDALMESMMDRWLPSYDVLFKAPNCYPLVADGVRDTDREFQAEVDRVIDTLLAEKGVAYVPLPDEGQLDAVLSYLRLEGL